MAVFQILTTLAECSAILAAFVGVAGIFRIHVLLERRRDAERTFAAAEMRAVASGFSSAVWFVVLGQIAVPVWCVWVWTIRT